MAFRLIRELEAERQIIQILYIVVNELAGKVKTTISCVSGSAPQKAKGFVHFNKKIHSIIAF